MKCQVCGEDMIYSQEVKVQQSLKQSGAMTMVCEGNSPKVLKEYKCSTCGYKEYKDK